MQAAGTAGGDGVRVLDSAAATAAIGNMKKQAVEYTERFGTDGDPDRGG